MFSLLLKELIFIFLFDYVVYATSIVVTMMSFIIFMHGMLCNFKLFYFSPHCSMSSLTFYEYNYIQYILNSPGTYSKKAVISFSLITMFTGELSMITPHFTFYFWVVASMARMQHQIVWSLTHCPSPMTRSYALRLSARCVVPTT